MTRSDQFVSVAWLVQGHRGARKFDFLEAQFVDMIERLEMGDTASYSPTEAAIHLARYALVKELCRGKQVLDVACGEGYGSAIMASEWGAAEVIGVDIEPSAIESARRNFGADNIRFEAGSASDLLDIVGERQFDLIVSLETIEHLSEPEVFLRQIKMLASPQASIVISCPNDYFYYPTDTERNPFHIRKYRFNEFLSLTEGQLGPVTATMIGVPIEGYSNVTLMGGSIARPLGSSALSITEFDAGAGVLGLPRGVEFGSEEASYFAGFWGPYTGESELSGAFFPIPMSSSGTRTATVVADLRGQVSDALTQVWEIRAANELLEDQVREAQLANELLEDQVREAQLANELLEDQVREARLLAAAREVEQEALEGNVGHLKANLGVVRSQLESLTLEVALEREAAQAAWVGGRARLLLQRIGIRRSRVRAITAKAKAKIRRAGADGSP